MNSLQIRLARVDDAGTACEVMRRSIAELCEADYGVDTAFLASWLANKTIENFIAWVREPGNYLYVAIDGQAVVGVASMKETGLVTLNYVSPDFRFKGISKALLARLEQKAAELGLRQCSLASTKTALRFYRSAGYREQGAGAQCGTPMIKDIVAVTTR